MTAMALAVPLTTPRADVRVATLAVDALTAADEVFGLDAHPLAYGQPGDARTKGGHLSGEFVSVLATFWGDVRARLPGSNAPVTVQVAPADTRCPHLNQHLARPGLGHGQLLHPYIRSAIE